MALETGSNNCPRCATPRIGSFRFCQSCAFDYDADPRHPSKRIPVWPGELTGEADSLAEASIPDTGSPTRTVADRVEAPDVARTPEVLRAEPEAPIVAPVLPPWPPEPQDEPPQPVPPQQAQQEPPQYEPPQQEPQPPQPREPPADVATEPAPGHSAPPARPSSVRQASIVLRTPAPAGVAQRFPRSGRWAIYLVGGLAIVLTTGALIASLLLSAPPGPTSARGSLPPAASSGAPVRSRIVISEPENGARIEGQQVTFRGTGPAGFELIQDSSAGTDPRTIIGADGSWVLDVALVEGLNEVTLRLGDDRSTEMTWSVSSVPAGDSSADPSAAATDALPGFDPITIRGSGDELVTLDILEGALAVAALTHGGSASFTVWALDANNNQTDLLVNASGTYQGRRLVNAENHASGLRVEAEGNWTIVLRPISAAPRWDGAGTLEGAGSEVYVLDPPAADFLGITLRHTGRGNFSVIGYSGDVADVHATAVGDYFGESLLREGTSILSIEAGGNWTIVLD